ncbi:hypothetical protein CRG98_019859 [Punica granatum]|uniref:G-patch domain-containing protein n=1 Tax=Punica granatum TaxID=22663 RepID=A0A2I0JWC2_PUNGR|nr:hypothetical protein CRG98_019859 [Punica granatum]
MNKTVYPVPLDPGDSTALDLRVVNSKWRLLLTCVRRASSGSSEPYREALLRVLTATQVPKETAPDHIEETVASIFSNNISFSDNKLPFEGWAHSRALHIICKCNNYFIGRVIIDNGSVLNVCPVSTLKQMNADLNCIRPSKTAVRAFDGSRREDWLITFKGEEDYAIYKETVVSYISIGDNENLPFHSFEIISVIQDYGEVGPSVADHMIWKVLLRSNYVPGTGLGAHGQGIRRPIEVEEYKNRKGLDFCPSCHEIIKARRGKHLHRLAAHYGRINKGMPVSLLFHFFPRSPHIVEDTLDGPSSDSDDAPVALPAVYAVTEETPSGVHIRLAQDNEELDNWTSVPRYSAVIADAPLESRSSTRQFVPVRGTTRRAPTHILRGKARRGRSSARDRGEFAPPREPSTHLSRADRRIQRGHRRRTPHSEDRDRSRLYTTNSDDRIPCRVLRGLCLVLRRHAEPGPFNSQALSPARYGEFPTQTKHLRWQRAGLLLRIKEEVIKQINTGFLQVCNYSEWVTNIVPVEKKDGRVRVCVDYRDLNKASPKDNFPLPHIDVLVDNIAHYTQLSFMDGFSRYNKIRMAEEDKIKTTFTTMWGTFCYRVVPIGLKNAGATY